MPQSVRSYHHSAQMGEQFEEVARYMTEHSLVMTTAESCTAGLIAAHIADVPGAGQLLECAFVVYSPQAKQKRLGVKAQTIERHNLTSEEVAREMARGALDKSDANLAVSNTGVADDTDPEIEAGTQCFAWFFAAQEGLPEKLFSETKRFTGDRNAIREQAAIHALTQIPHMHAQFLQPAHKPAQPTQAAQKQHEGQASHEH
ncbi:MAG: ompetence-damaged protein [Polaromonas sp.]|nr:ompetence-damaged protein [Polaromonas sp.]